MELALHHTDIGHDLSFAESVINTVREPLVVLDHDFRVQKANRAFYKTFRVGPDETLDHEIYQLGDRQWDIPELRELLEKVLVEDTHFDDLEVTHYFERIGLRTMLLNGRRVLRDHDTILLAIEDITERKRAAEESTFLSAIVQGSEDSIITVDFNGIITTCNKAAERIYGFSANEAIGKHLSILSRDTDYQTVQRFLDKMRSGTGVERFQIKRRRKDGREIYISIQLSPILGPNGELIGISTVTRDITERKRREEERERFFAVGTDLLVISNLTGFFKWVSPAWVRTLGWTPEELTSRPWLEFVHPEDVAATRDCMERIKHGEEPIDFQNRYRCKNGTYRWLSWKGRSYLDEGLLYGGARDITERKEAEQKFFYQYGLTRALIENAPAALFMVDAENRITMANREAERIFGWKPEDIIGRPMHETLHHHYADGRFYPVEECVFIQAIQAKRSIRDEEHVLFHKDGTPVHALCSSTALPTEHAAGDWILVVRDITQRKRAEVELKLSEERFRQLFSSAPIGLALFDLNTRFLRVNPAFSEMMGYSEEELLQLTVADLSRPEDHPEMARRLSQLKDGEIAQFEVEVRHIRKNKEVIWVHTTASLLRNAEGKPESFLGAVREVTTRKRLEHALRESEQQMRLMMENVKDFAILSMEPDGRVNRWNPGAEHIFGYSDEEVLDQNIDALVFTPEDVAAGIPEEERQTAAKTGQAIDERWHVRKNGERFFASGAMRPILDDAGSLRGFIKIARDITERKQMEEQLLNARENLEKTVQHRTSELQTKVGELEAFSYSVSHDLRAPLRAMQGFSEFLLEDYADKLDPVGRDYVLRIVKAAERLDRLVSDILTYSRVARGNIETKRIALEKLIEDVIQSYPALQHPEVTIEVKSPLVPVIGHEGSLTQCISNLLGNAIKFVPEGKHPHVKIWTERVGDKVCVFFQDNGIGIPHGQEEKVFRMFEKASHNRVYEGTGIGLAIVRKAVERMGGEVGVNSEPGEGSTFWIKLPAA